MSTILTAIIGALVVWLLFKFIGKAIGCLGTLVVLALVIYIASQYAF